VSTPVSKIQDPDVRCLAALATDMSNDYLPSDAWVGSPFAWILQTPSRTKGAIGEKLVAGWAASKGFDVVRSPNSDADRVINGHRIEIKLSTLWANGGFKFQQIRDQDYDYCFCLGISPFDAQAWLLPKDVLREEVIGVMGQHTGAGGKDTAWLGFNEEQPYDWMKPYGGRLRAVARLIEKAGYGAH